MKWSDDKLKLREQMYERMDEIRDRKDEENVPASFIGIDLAADGKSDYTCVMEVERQEDGTVQYTPVFDADDWVKIRREGGIESSGRYADLTRGKKS